MLEAVKGQKKKEITVPGTPLEDNETESDFGSHKAQAFWDEITAARTSFTNDCRLNPKFKIGNRYLVFFKEPYQAKSFELVKNKGDRWYKHVFETLYPPKRIKQKTAAAEAPAPAAPAAEAPAPAAPTN